MARRMRAGGRLCGWMVMLVAAVLLLLASIDVHASEQQQTSVDTSSLRSLYHSTGELYREYAALARRCSYLSLRWVSGRGVGPKGSPTKSLLTLHINYNPEQYPNKSERALLLFGEHARELISPELALSWVRMLCGEGQQLDGSPVSVNMELPGVGGSIEQILRTTELLLFPNANPSGRRRTEQGDYCNRVNDRGVDLNRGWGEHWSRKHDGPSTYSGPSAWSEAEVVMMAREAARFKPTIFISVHSGSLNMLSPFAFKRAIGGEPAASTTAVDPPGLTVSAPVDDGERGSGLKPVFNVLHKVNTNFCRCTIGPAGKELGYLSAGTCLDYVYNRLGTRYAFALEIYAKGKYAKDRAALSLLEEGERQLGGSVDELLEESMQSEFLTHTLPSDVASYPLPLEAEAENDVFVETASEMDTDADADADVDADVDAEGELDSELDAELDLDAEVDVDAEAEADMEAEAESELDASHELYTSKNDADVIEPSKSSLFPAPLDHRSRSCLLNFNPATPDLYKRTIDHWSRGLLAFIHTIHQSRPHK